MSQDMTGRTEHPMLAALGDVEAVLDGVVGGNCWSMSDADVGEFLDRVTAVEARLAAAKLAVIADADLRHLGVAEATTTAGWLRSRLRMDPGDAGRAVRLATALRSDCAATGAALAAGGVSVQQAEVITRTIAGLPPVDPATRVQAEELLITQAAALDPLLLRQAGQALIETLTTEPDDDDAREVRRQTRRDVTMTPAYDGMVALRGLLSTENAALLAAALNPLAAPRPAADGTRDPRTAGQRRADALVDLARIGLTHGDLPSTGGVKPTLVVTIRLRDLIARIGGAGLLPTGDSISAGAARRLGCDAKIIPVVLGGASQPLDIGRAARTVPPPMHAALVARDQACAFPGCDRLAAWSEAHHVIHWAHGGITALSNLVLVCLEHHNAVHLHGWSVTIDDDGLPTFRAPPWIDPDQRPRRHHRYALRQLDYDINGHDPPE